MLVKPLKKEKSSLPDPDHYLRKVSVKIPLFNFFTLLPTPRSSKIMTNDERAFLYIDAQKCTTLYIPFFCETKKLKNKQIPNRKIYQVHSEMKKSTKNIR